MHSTAEKPLRRHEMLLFMQIFVHLLFRMGTKDRDKLHSHQLLTLVALRLRAKVANMS
jgi:hypothetical protein